MKNVTIYYLGVMLVKDSLELGSFLLKKKLSFKFT